MTGYGDLVNAFHGRFTSLIDFVDSSFAQGILGARNHELLPTKTLSELEIVHRKLKSLVPDAPSTLVWGDVAPDNIIIDDQDRLAGLIDFEGALAGDPIINLGYCYSRYCKTDFFDAIVRNWPLSLGTDHWRRIELYAVLRAVRILRFAHEPLPNAQPRTPIEQLLPGFVDAIGALAAQ